MSEHSNFLKITSQRYRNMVARSCCDLPYTLTQFRDWHLDGLKTVEGTVQCFYCHAHINIYTMEIDHKWPLAQGGGLELQNLCFSCRFCNQQKGKMRSEAYLALLELVNDHELFTAVDRTDCLGRLQHSLKLALLHQKAQGPKTRIMPHTRAPR